MGNKISDQSREWKARADSKSELGLKNWIKRTKSKIKYCEPGNSFKKLQLTNELNFVTNYLEKKVNNITRTNKIVTRGKTFAERQLRMDERNNRELGRNGIVLKEEYCPKLIHQKKMIAKSLQRKRDELAEDDARKKLAKTFVEEDLFQGIVLKPITEKPCGVKIREEDKVKPYTWEEVSKKNVQDTINNIVEEALFNNRIIDLIKSKTIDEVEEWALKLTTFQRDMWLYGKDALSREEVDIIILMDYEDFMRKWAEDRFSYITDIFLSLKDPNNLKYAKK